jgi:hypothetical protein
MRKTLRSAGLSDGMSFELPEKSAESEKFSQMPQLRAGAAMLTCGEREGAGVKPKDSNSRRIGAQSDD